MPRTIYLHVGMPKCATTSVQSFLDRNTDWLARNGVAYPRHPEDQTRGQGNAAELAALLMHRQTDKARARLNHFLAQEGDVILSSEILFGVARGDLFAQMADHLAEQEAQVRVICYLRRQDLWLESDFKQHIKGNPDWTGKIGELLRKRLDNRTLNYNWMMENWARCASDDHVTVVPLNPGQAADYPLRRFVDFLGLTQAPGATFDLPADNVSPATALIEPARLIKLEAVRAGLSQTEVMDRVARFFDTAPEIIEVPKRRFMLPYKTRKGLVDKHNEVNQRLSARFLDGAPLFNPISESDSLSEGDLTNEAAQVLAAFTLRQGYGDLATVGARPKLKRGLARIFPRRG